MLVKRILIVVISIELSLFAGVAQATVSPGAWPVDTDSIIVTDIDETINEHLKKTDDTIKTAAELIKSAHTAEVQVLGLSEDPAAGFQPLTVEVKTLIKNGLFVRAGNVANQFDIDEQNLKKLRDDLCDKNSETFVAATCQSALNKTKTQIDRLQAQKVLLKKSCDNLKAALNATYSSAKDFLGQLGQTLGKLDRIPNNAEGEMLLETLPPELSVLANTLVINQRMTNDWSELSPVLLILVSAGATDQEAAEARAADGEVAEAAKAVKRSTEMIKLKLNDWLETTQALAETKNDDYRKLLDEIRQNPELSAQAVTAAEQTEIMSGKLDQIIYVCNQLKGLLNNEVNPDFKYADFVKKVEQIESTRRQQISLLPQFEDAATGDFANFEGDYVPLYYFTDVPNLMHILNSGTREIRDQGGLREDAERLRRNLNEADITLADAQAEQSALQTRLIRLREELDNAERAKNSSFNLLAKAEKRLAGIDGETDKIKRQIAQKEVDNRKSQDDVNQTNLEKLQNEQNGLPLKIGDAEARLLEAQRRVRASRRDMLLLAQVESDAFAKTRDHEAVFYAPILATSQDPLKRVLIYSFGNRKVVYLRGTRANLNKAKKIIALLDRPAPQARLTLWTLELNGEATLKGSRRFNESLEEIERGLSVTRTQITAALNILRNEVNREVNRKAAETFQTYSALNENELADLRWARLRFYQKEVLLRFGVKQNVGERQNEVYLSSISLPDPAGTATLGEALIVLTLASSNSRGRILKNFQQELVRKFDEDATLCLSRRRKECVKKAVPPNEWFARTITMLTGDDTAVHDGSQYQSLTAQQKEITETLLSATYPRILRRINKRLDLYVNSISGKARMLRKKQELRSLDNSKSLEVDRGDFEKELDNSFKTVERLNTTQVAEDAKLLKFLLDWLWSAADLKDNESIGDELNCVSDLTQNKEASADSICQKIKLNDSEKEINKTLKNKNLEILNRILGLTLHIKDRVQFLENRLAQEKPLTTANARVARVDLLLKQMIDAVDEDLSRHFIQPALVALRTELTDAKGIGVGIVNRSSMLSTNRLMARVDARSSAQLAIGEEQDVLQGIQQLANIYLATKTGGAFGAFDSLNALPRKDPSEIYGLTSGNAFKVTPLFDPTGQTLRFKFDFVHANQVQEPNGSTTPQLPRIERHTINTEVELNNLELRELSRFNTNARIGIPTKKSGGIPLLKDIPGADKIPLIGWFTRRAGKDAVIQESLIFGQTTMYPTIGDLYELLHGLDYEGLGNEERELYAPSRPQAAPEIEVATAPK